MLNTVLGLCSALLALAFVLTLWRLWRGPSSSDRVLALDTLSVIAVGFLLLLNIWRANELFFELALLLALLGFVGTVALSKYMLRGDLIE